MHKGQHLTFILSQELILEACAKLKDMITKHFVGLEVFSGVYGVPLNSSNLQNNRGDGGLRLLYSLAINSKESLL